MNRNEAIVLAIMLVCIIGGYTYLGSFDKRSRVHVPDDSVSDIIYPDNIEQMEILEAHGFTCRRDAAPVVCHPPALVGDE